MSPDDTRTGIDRTVILERAHDRRAGCYDAMALVRAAMDRPFGAEPAAWRARIRTSLRDLKDAFEAHIEVTEQAGGLLDRVADVNPYLAAASERLRAEHVALRNEIESLILLLGTVPPPPEEPTRRRVIRILHRVARHRRAGTDLVSEAIEVDLGRVAG